MFASFLDSLISLGYVAGGIGFLLCVVGYFVFPKMLKAVMETDTDNEESE